MILAAPMKIDLLQYHHILQSIAGKYPIQYQEELIQEMYCQLPALIIRFKAASGSFKTYAFKRLNGACIDFLNKYSLNHESLDEWLTDDGEEIIRKVDMLEDESSLEESITQLDYLTQKDKTLMDVERFIRKKYYVDGLKVSDIQRVYYPYHLIKSTDTIYKILKK